MENKLNISDNKPIEVQESYYRLPYHWFPDERLIEFKRIEKRRIIFEMIDQYSNTIIQDFLDIGCGDGRWTSEINNRYETNSFGIDFSKRAIEFAKLISPDIEFQRHKGEELPYSKNTFDLCTTIEVIEHIEDKNENKFLKECARVLKPQGLLILTTPSEKLRLTEHHYRHYTVKRLKELINANGFELLSIRGQSLPCYGYKRKIRKVMSRNSKIWKLWKYTYKEVVPDKALNLFIAARTIK